MAVPELQRLRAERRFNLLVVGAVLLGFLTLVLVSGIAVSVMLRNFSYADWVSHTYRVQSGIADLRTLDERLETARRGYLLSKDERFANAVLQVKTQINTQIDYLQSLTADNLQEQHNIGLLRGRIADQFKAVDVSMAFARNGANDSSRFYEDSGVNSTRDIRIQTDAMVAEENRLLRIRDMDRARSTRALVIISAVAGLLLLFVAIGSVVVILRYTRALVAARTELVGLNAGLEEQVASRTSDLQRANDEIQRFAYIVSHDLRSPLVNVMGFTSELEAAAQPMTALLERAEAEAPGVVTDEARTAIRTDLPESIGFIRTSTQKMDRLINAILQLSRQGRRVLAAERLDMNRLAQAISDNLKHRSGELGAEIVIDPDLPPVFSDRLALEQIFSNLVENALKYLKAGRPGRIEISGHRQGPRVVYEIKDNGRGIDPKDHDRVFDLFRRAGVQDQPGEGIGLAHVRALAYRLGGTISVDSALDQGATFRVSLPERLSTEGPAS